LAHELKSSKCERKVFRDLGRFALYNSFKSLCALQLSTV
jgi:hypothetical protein